MTISVGIDIRLGVVKTALFRTEGDKWRVARAARRAHPKRDNMPAGESRV